MIIKHIDEIRKEVIAKLIALLKMFPDCRIVLIHDLYGRFKLILWPGEEQEKAFIGSVTEELKVHSPQVETDNMWISNTALPELDKKVYENAWEEGEPHIDEPRLRILERYRSHGGWIGPMAQPPWPRPSSPDPQQPPILVFYSFKGGVGRTTALAAFALQRARAGERVVVIDADLDAPGIGTLLSSDTQGNTAVWGVVDYLLEKEPQETNSMKIGFSDYYHACRRENLTGAGEIMVVPAGTINGDYPWKLARLDLEPYADKSKPHVFHRLIEDVRDYLKPGWILIDVRAGLAVPAGILIGGFAHLNVIFGTSSEQSWCGLRLIIERLGGRRVQAGLAQEDLILVQAMVPRNADLARNAEDIFSERALDVFTELYYAEYSSDESWGLEDTESSEAPHVPIPIHYDEQLTNFRQIDQVAESLIESPDYKRLTERILGFFQR